MRRTLAGLALVAALTLALGTLAACGGESEEDRALTQVCDARADIGTQVDALRNVTPAMMADGEVGHILETIRTDIQTIRDAREDLSGERRAEANAANEAFATEVRSLGAAVVAGDPPAQAEAQIQASVQQLADSYRDTYGQIDCPEE
jgi:hypothetical protein